MQYLPNIINEQLVIGNLHQFCNSDNCIDFYWSITYFLLQETKQKSVSIQNGCSDKKKSEHSKQKKAENGQECSTKLSNVVSKDTEEKKPTEDKTIPKQCVNTSSGESKTSKIAPCKSNSDGFGGMQKGFLFGGPAPKNKASSVKQTVGCDKGATKTPTTLEDIPYVKKSDQPKDGGLMFSEVQEEMAKTNEKLMQNKGLFKYLYNTCN